MLKAHTRISQRAPSVIHVLWIHSGDKPRLIVCEECPLKAIKLNRCNEIGTVKPYHCNRGEEETSAGKCNYCELGKFSEYGDKCLLCEKGYYCPDVKMYKIEPCPKGTYQNETGMTAKRGLQEVP